MRRSMSYEDLRALVAEHGVCGAAKIVGRTPGAVSMAMRDRRGITLPTPLHERIHIWELDGGADIYAMADRLARYAMRKLGLDRMDEITDGSIYYEAARDAVRDALVACDWDGVSDPKSYAYLRAVTAVANEFRRRLWQDQRGGNHDLRDQV